MTARTLIATLALVAVAVMVGCGGGDSSGSSGSTGVSGSTAATTESSTAGSTTDNGSEGAEGGGSLTKAELVKQANAICEQERADLLTGIGAYVQSHEAEGQSNAALAATKSVLVPNMETQISKVSALGVPAGEAQKFDAFLSAWQGGIEKGSEISSPNEIATIFAPAGKLARELGLAACAYG